MKSSIKPLSPAAAEEVSKQIGPRLKAARARSGLSLRALGERIDFSASFLSQVELGQVSPSLGSLERIAQALGLSLVDLLADEKSGGEPVLRRRDREKLRSEWSKATLESLIPAGADARMEARLLGLEPDGQTGKMVHPAAKEFAFCLKGKVTLHKDGTEHKLGEGDSMLHDAGQPGRWENSGRSRAELLLVLVRAM